MRVEPLELELAFDLVDLVDPARGGDLLDRVKGLRRKIATELGLDHPARPHPRQRRPHHDSYAIRIHGVEVATGIAPAGASWPSATASTSSPATPTIEPVFGLPAKWVPAELRQQASWPAPPSSTGRR